MFMKIRRGELAFDNYEDMELVLSGLGDMLKRIIHSYSAYWTKNGIFIQMPSRAVQ